MKTRVIALVLCALMLIPMFTSCSNEVVESYMQMYFSHQVYDLDPLNAYTNDAQLKIVSLVFSGLYKIDEKGKVQKDLVKEAEVINDEDKDEYTIRLTLNNTCWSDGSAVSADDVVYTFKRILKAQKSNDAASMLFSIKNAVKVKNGDVSIDDLGVYAVDTTVVEIQFEDYITDEDFEEFKLSLTSPALFPLRENQVEGKEDWAKKPATMVYSGPFIVRKVSYEDGKKQMTLERNAYYFRNKEKDADDKYVTPYKIIVDFEVSAEEQLNLYSSGQVLFVNDIPLSLRGQYDGQVEKLDTLSTHTYYFNQEAVISSTKAGEEEGVKLFAIPEVRQALSVVINRQAIANLVVYAKPATGLLTDKMFNAASRKSLFADGRSAKLASGEDKAKAESLLQSAGINASDYTFSITVRAYDDVHMAIAQAVEASWESLGFNVEIDAVDVVVNEEKDSTNEVPTDIRDDRFDEIVNERHGGNGTTDTADDEVNNYRNYDVLALDFIAKSPNALSVLAPFAIDYAGNLTVSGTETVEVPHLTGYNSEAYNELIKKAFAATNADERANYLHQAEEMLVITDAAVAPIVFNQAVYMASDSLSKVGFSYYGWAILTEAKLKDWQDYRDVYFPETSEEETTVAGDPTDEPVA